MRMVQRTKVKLKPYIAVLFLNILLTVLVETSIQICCCSHRVNNSYNFTCTKLFCLSYFTIHELRRGLTLTHSLKSYIQLTVNQSSSSFFGWDSNWKSSKMDFLADSGCLIRKDPPANVKNSKQPRPKIAAKRGGTVLKGRSRQQFVEVDPIDVDIRFFTKLLLCLVPK